MARTQSDLSVRLHHRRTCDHAARVSVPTDASASVVIARGVGDATGELEARIVDFSAGGVGLGVGVFLPRGCPLRLRLTGAGSGLAPVTLVVRRVQMTDSTPRYYIGAAFAEPEPGSDASVRALLSHLEAATPVEAGGGP